MRAAQPAVNAPFSGSYDPQDCLFLLTPIALRDTPVADKERLIQSGRRHYSEMINLEQPPSKAYTELFLALTARYKERLAAEILALAAMVRQRRPPPVTVVSLARAGTPVGALLHRALGRLEVASRHYSISIIRDRGIDRQALAHILRVENRPAAGIVFVDGWTAKGVISRELKRAIARWNAEEPEQLADELYVVADIGGTADVAATHDDYVIPNGVMNSTVSGLVSRSVLNGQIRPGDFHGCVVYHQLRPYDRSRWFLDEISRVMAAAAPAVLPARARDRQALTQGYLARVRAAYGVSDDNRIKPGIAEATRVLLRRLPDVVLLRDPQHPDVAHLKVLAGEKGVPVEVDAGMPFNAAALIRDVL